MKKRGILIVMIVFLIFIVSVNAYKVDYKVEEEIELEQLVEEKPPWVRWFFVIAIIILALLIAIYIAVRRYLKSSK